MNYDSDYNYSLERAKDYISTHKDDKIRRKLIKVEDYD